MTVGNLDFDQSSDPCTWRLASLDRESHRETVRGLDGISVSRESCATLIKRLFGPLPERILGRGHPALGVWLRVGWVDVVPCGSGRSHRGRSASELTMVPE